MLTIRRAILRSKVMRRLTSHVSALACHVWDGLIAALVPGTEAHRLARLGRQVRPRDVGEGRGFRSGSPALFECRRESRVTRDRRHTLMRARLAWELAAAEALCERARRAIRNAREVVSETVESVARMQDTLAQSGRSARF